jgi:hypothetical protein
MICKRHYFKWNNRELIELQREYELLELSIQEIANRHQRSINAILCRLEKENFIRHWNQAKGFDSYIKEAGDLDYYVRRCDDDDDDDDDDSLSDLIEESDIESDITSVVSEDIIEPNFLLQLNKISFITGVKKFIDDLSYVAKKFSTSTRTNNSNNLAEI